MARAIDADELEKKFGYGPNDTEEERAFNQAARKIIREMLTLTPPNEWVRVEDAMPPEHEPVLCIVDGKPKPNITLEDAYQIGSWNKADGWIIDEYLDWEDADVSWWMSLPEPPGKDNNVPAKTPNEPLTIEQLREMDGEPVWLDDEKTWALLQVWDDDNIDAVFPMPRGCFHAESVVGKKIYRRPPEGEEDT